MSDQALKEVAAMNLGTKLFGHRFIEELSYDETEYGSGEATERFLTLTAALRDAERRGAEAMREAAARQADAEAISDVWLGDPALGLTDNARRIAANIRALPLPGDPLTT